MPAPRPSGLVFVAPAARHHSGFRSKKVRSAFSNCDKKILSASESPKSGRAKGMNEKERKRSESDEIFRHKIIHSYPFH